MRTYVQSSHVLLLLLPEVLRLDDRVLLPATRLSRVVVCTTILPLLLLLLTPQQRHRLLLLLLLLLLLPLSSLTTLYDGSAMREPHCKKCALPSPRSKKMGGARKAPSILFLFFTHQYRTGVLNPMAARFLFERGACCSCFVLYKANKIKINRIARGKYATHPLHSRCGKTVCLA